MQNDNIKDNRTVIMEDPATFTFIIVFIVVSVFITIFLVLRCLLQGKKCPSRNRLDGKVVLITGADNKEGIELVKELVKRGAERIIMAVANLDLGQDVALEVRAELNGNVVAEYCDMSSITSIREFCTKMLETESRLHILINHHTVMWEPLKRTKEGHEWHWGCNHLAHFVVTQLLMPLLLRGTPDARVITLSSSWYTRGKILWDNPDYLENPHYPHRDSSVNAERNSSVPIASPENSSSSKSKEHASFQIESGSDQKRVNRRRYNATEAFNQSKLANILFSRQLSERMEGTGVNTYAVNPGIVRSGLGIHILKGLGCCGLTSALVCWLPWLKSPANAIQTTVYCASDPSLADQSGLYYSNCGEKFMSLDASNMDDAHRLWEMSERMVRLTS